MTIQSVTENVTHTPGPWSFTVSQPSSLSGGSVAYVSADTGHKEIAVLYSDEQQKANARLIAAAPELLEACKAAYVALPMAKHNDEINAALRAAIAKAEGAR